ncbi:hypothetical protein AXE65_00870 [Ventosimonas gracilis]|uniref:DUF1640 domain-containing protein n=2 Tax=Ventosimonas gracilis TaxID=1680762 RepID=A0A139SW89_9GAMM|nr:hypothetical protein AXE65_00870 [Ventosimonas gracilis]
MSSAAFNSFDTLQFAKKFKAAKDSEEQAEVVAQAFREGFDERDKALREGFDERDKALAAVEAKVSELAADAKNNAEKMATKEDVVRLEGRITNLEQSMNAKMEGLENRLIVKLGKMLTIGVGLIVTSIGIAAGIIIKLMPHV